MNSVDISIFIRTRNEAQYIEQCLNSLKAQQHPYSVEVLVLDSSSTDRTLEIAQACNAKVFSIPKELFSYSAALNAGVKLARGTYFVALSAHCIPSHNHWLLELISPLESHSKCAATYSRHLPWPEASIPEVLQMKRDFPPAEKTLTPDLWKLALGEGKEPYSTAVLSNTAAAYRRTTILELPFRTVNFSEDRLMAIDLLNAGYAVSYAARSEAYHLHYPILKEFRSVARSATKARFAINSFSAQLSNSSTGNTTALPSVAWARAKIIAYILWLAISIWIPIFPGRKNRLREVAWRLASLGTTLGKYEGALALRNGALPVELRPACPNAILSHLKEGLG